MKTLREAVLSGLLGGAALQHLLSLEAPLGRLLFAKGPEPWNLSPTSVLVGDGGAARLDAVELLSGRWPQLFGRGSKTSDGIYSAPETISADGDPTRALVYSVGMVVCFCFYGAELPARVARAKAAPELYRSAMIELLRCLEAPNELKTCLIRATAFDPVVRPGSLPQLFGELRRAAESRIRSDVIEMVAIPGGRFEMGLRGEVDESPMPLGPPRSVELSSFSISKYPITQSVYERVMGGNPSRRPAEPDAPVNGVRFEQAVTFCNMLSKCEGLKLAYPEDGQRGLDTTSDGYRLPTEAEWELAARGFQPRRYPWGDDAPGLRACWNGPGNVYGEGNRRGPSPVGWHPEGASPFGVMDMAGGVWEWCNDLYRPYELEGEVLRNPLGPSESVPPFDWPPGSYRVVRGGAWNTTSEVWLRAVARAVEREESEHDDIGFRVARGRLAP